MTCPFTLAFVRQGICRRQSYNSNRRRPRCTCLLGVPGKLHEC